VSALATLARATLERPPDQRAIQFEGQWTSWGELQALTRRALSYFEAVELDRSESVVIVVRNTPAVFALLLACFGRSQNVRTLYPFLSTKALIAKLDELKAAVVCIPEVDLTEPLKASMRANDRLCISYSERGISQEHAPTQPLLGSSHSGSPFIEIQTSGTTGAPKHFRVSYTLIENFMLGPEVVEHAESGEPFDCAEVRPELLFFPIGNITGLHTSVAPLIKGVPIVLLPKFDLDAWLDYVRTYRPERAGIPPAAMQALLDRNIPQADLASLQSMGSGAAPLSAELHEAFEERYGIHIHLAYGATEFGGPVCAMTPALRAEFGDAKRFSIGRPFPGFSMRILDSESGRELEDNELGVLEVISPRIGDSWIRTSDLARRDEDGCYTLHGRADSALFRGGFKVIPDQVEAVLAAHPAIHAVCIVGVPDSRLGQVPACAYTRKSDHRDSSAEDFEQALAAFVREKMPATHVPVYWRELDSLPLTASFKISRADVAALF